MFVEYLLWYNNRPGHSPESDEEEWEIAVVRRDASVPTDGCVGVWVLEATEPTHVGKPLIVLAEHLI